MFHGKNIAPDAVRGFSALAKAIAAHELLMRQSFSLIPSENALSPLARAILTTDGYSRYYFDDDRLWGRWAFPGGKEIGNVQENVLLPSLRRLSGAAFVNIRAVSGLSNMLVCLAAFCEPGAIVAVMPPQLGGHASTKLVAERLGLNAVWIPYGDAQVVDEDELIKILRTSNVALIYVDQANVLFPADVATFRRCIQLAGSSAYLHIDTSHINGLVFGGVLKNPLVEGADSFGGSLHKTFPGPHKAYVATNSSELITAVNSTAAHLISHHHSADVLALAVTLLEFEVYGGRGYAAQTVQNAQAFARALHEQGFAVAAAEIGFTQTHQTWISTEPRCQPDTASERLFNVGVIVNAFSTLPGLANGGLRIGLSEATRLGITENVARELGVLCGQAIVGIDSVKVRHRVRELREAFPHVRHCLDACRPELEELVERFIAAASGAAV